MGGVAQDRLPDLSDLLSKLKLDEAEFVSWLSGRIGKIRPLVDEAGGDVLIPSLKVEKAEIKKFLDLIGRLRPYLDPGGLPPTVSAMLWEAAYVAEMDWDQEAGEASRLLTRLSAIAIPVGKQIERTTGARGAPTKQSRDILLSEVVARLIGAGSTANSARESARLILERCGMVVTTSSDEDAERSIRRAQKRGQ